MTRTAEQSIVLEPAFTAAVGHRNDVIGFPARTKDAPGAARGAIPGRRLRSRPLAVRLHDVRATELTDALVALEHFSARMTIADNPCLACPPYPAQPCVVLKMLPAPTACGFAITLDLFR